MRRYRLAYLPSMDEEVPLPTEPFKGYPAKYLPTLEPHDIDGCRCDTFGFWRKHLRNVTHAFASGYGPEHSCMHASLLLQRMGLSVMASPRSIMYDESPEEQFDINRVPVGPPPKFFEDHK